MLLCKIVANVSIPQQKKEQECIIPLIREAEEKQQIVLKLCSNPSQADSQLYKIVTCAFNHGTPEEWICYQRIMQRILIGQKYFGEFWWVKN